MQSGVLYYFTRVVITCKRANSLCAHAQKTMACVKFHLSLFHTNIVFVHHKCPNSAKAFLPEGTSALTPLSRSEFTSRLPSMRESKAVKYRSSESANHRRARPVWVPSPKVPKIFLASEQNLSCERLSNVRATRKCSRVPDLLARSQFPRSARSALSVCVRAERICALAGNNYACEIIYTPDCMFYHASAFWH